MDTRYFPSYRLAAVISVGMCGYAVGMVYKDQAKGASKRSLLTADDAVWTNLLTV